MAFLTSENVTGSRRKFLGFCVPLAGMLMSAREAMAGIKVFRAAETKTAAADPKNFAGKVTQKPIGTDDAGVPARALRVDFEDGGRTNWHTHTGPQWLLVTEGAIRVQKMGEPVQDLKTGDAVVIQPGEKHWHGSVPGTRGVHIAVMLNATTNWMEPVTDQQYKGT
jgi:quercetin dioxygenase-like cupin family protein